MKPLKPWCSFADQLQHLQDRGLQVDNPVAALMKLVIAQMRTDAYTACRGVGHIEAKARPSDSSGQVEGELRGAPAYCRQALLERVLNKVLALPKSTNGGVAT